MCMCVRPSMCLLGGGVGGRQGQNRDQKSVCDIYNHAWKYKQTPPQSLPSLIPEVSIEEEEAWTNKSTSKISVAFFNQSLDPDLKKFKCWQRQNKHPKEPQQYWNKQFKHAKRQFVFCVCKTLSRACKDFTAQYLSTLLGNSSSNPKQDTMYQQMSNNLTTHMHQKCNL